MSFSINTNIASLQAQNYLRTSSDFQSKTISRVTSGLRILSSGDDAAGLAIANGLRSDQAVLTQGIRNANDGLSTLQTIDGGMNNISQLLDRARTLATQSASGTFTGDRNVLNSEFASVMGEINRQAQSIGLDQGGQFAKSLAVFIGGGRSNNGFTAIQNGSVSVDLSKSTVDTKSLGLAAMQAAGNSSLDLASSTQGVSKILADTTNQGSESTLGFTKFTFSGANFSGSDAATITVNLSGVTDTASLVTAINSAISDAANPTTATAASTAFKNAGITASVVTGSNGQQSLAFTSSNAAFQVQADDRTANALLGNQVTGSATGKAISATLVAGNPVSLNATTSAVTKIRFQGGGLSAAQDLTLGSGSTTADLATMVNTGTSDEAKALQAAGISAVADGTTGALTFTSKSGQVLSVMATGDSTNALGLGTFQTNAAGDVDYKTLTGSTFAAGAGSAKGVFQFSLNGEGSTKATLTGGGAVNTNTNTTLGLTVNGTSFTVNFALDANKGAAETVDNMAAFINATARANGVGGDIASNVNGKLTLKSVQSGANSAISITASGAAFGFTTTSATGTGGAVVSVAAGTSGTVGGGGTWLSSLNGETLKLTVDTHAINTTFAGTANMVDVATMINANAANTGYVTASVDSNGHLVLTSNSSGTASNVTVGTTAGGSTANTDIGIADSATNTGAARTISQAADALKTAIQADATLNAAGMTATADTSANTITVSSGTVGGYFRVDTSGASAFGFAGGVAGYAGPTASVAAESVVNAGGAYQSEGYSFTPITNGGVSQNITIEANDSAGTQHSVNIVLENSGASATSVRNARNIDEAIKTINDALQGSNESVLQNIVAVKDNSSGTEQIKFISSNAFSITSPTTTGAAGLGNQNTTKNVSTVAAGGASVDISSQSSAQNAVAALANAVTALGTAQAAVGKGQNNFNFAINLAQSQTTNLAAAESRIRDADLAQEAANLSKAQILVQAGTAALAQANSAPQAVLALLRG